MGNFPVLLSGGPSPRARGAVGLLVSNLRSIWTIPACAGSSWIGSECESGSRDHPRVRGEQVESKKKVQDFNGPSPRARGAVMYCGLSGIDVSDHPRVRGEQDWCSVDTKTLGGPSPRARGAEQTLLRDGLDLRTIPACAGSSRTACGPTSRTADHPRVRGEQQAPYPRIATILGPSPRARGAAHRAGRPRPRARTIPACAGSSQDRPGQYR